MLMYLLNFQVNVLSHPVSVSIKCKLRSAFALILTHLLPPDIILQMSPDITITLTGSIAVNRR